MGLFTKRYCGICGEQIKGQYWYRRDPNYPKDINRAYYLICGKCHKNWDIVTLGGFESFPIDPKETKILIDKGLETLKTNGILEKHMKCDSCGDAFRYTSDDIARNEMLRKQANQATNTAILELLGGTRLAANQQTDKADRLENQIIDYNKCPKCGSNKLTKITAEEFRAIKDKQNGVITNNVSSADELKKFKELLDIGVITQEEFDAKKKQLLGL